ncbi:oxidative stress defense protein [Vibrio sp.]|uniref:oxidative stress defense protein n=1 Tax=Vibrio sp. TaxID=678 RepID=UPI003D10A62A
MKLFSIVTLSLATLFSTAGFAESYNFPHIVTTGFGEVIAKPDQAKFIVRAVETADSSEAVKQAVDKSVSGFIDQLKQSGVSADDITGSNLFLAPQYKYERDQAPELVGYRASRTVTVIVNDLAKLNQYLDMALAKGINQVDSVQLMVKDEQAFQKQARQAAIKDAMTKAAELAEGFGKQLDQVWRIDYNTPLAQPVFARSSMMDAKSQSESYQDSTMVIKDRVDVVYKLSN